MSVGGRERRKAARPGEIAAAALALFTEKGFAATRMQDVAARAGVAKGTLYLYFPTKEELFFAVVNHRLVLNFAARTDGITAADVIADIRRGTEPLSKPLPKGVSA